MVILATAGAISWLGSTTQKAVLLRIKSRVVPPPIAVTVPRNITLIRSVFLGFMANTPVSPNTNMAIRLKMYM
jgi:hypothetical protein